MPHRMPFDNASARERLLIEHHCQATVCDLLERPLPRAFVRAALAVFDAPGAPKLTDKLFQITSDGPEHSTRGISALANAAVFTPRSVRSRKLAEHFKAHPSCVLEEICAKLPKGASPHKDEALIQALMAHSPSNAATLRSHGASLIGKGAGPNPSDTALFILCAGQSNSDHANLWLDDEQQKSAHKARADLLASGLSELGSAFASAKHKPEDWIPDLLAACLRARTSSRGQQEMAMPHFKAFLAWAKPWMERVDWSKEVALESNHEQNGSILYELMPAFWNRPCSLAQMAIQSQRSAPDFHAILAPIALAKPPAGGREILGARLFSHLRHHVEFQHRGGLTSAKIASEMKAIAQDAAELACLRDPASIGNAPISNYSQPLPDFSSEQPHPHEFVPGWGSACATLLFGIPTASGFSFKTTQAKALEQAILLSGHLPESPSWAGFSQDFAQRACANLLVGTAFDLEGEHEEPISIQGAIDALDALAKQPAWGAPLANATWIEILRQAPEIVRQSTRPELDFDHVASMGDFVEPLKSFARDAPACADLATYYAQCAKLFSEAEADLNPQERSEIISAFELFSLQAQTVQGSVPGRAHVRI